MPRLRARECARLMAFLHIKKVSDTQALQKNSTDAVGVPVIEFEAKAMKADRAEAVIGPLLPAHASRLHGRGIPGHAPVASSSISPSQSS